MQGGGVKQGHRTVMGAHQHTDFGTAQDDGLRALSHQIIDDTAVDIPRCITNMA
jgi:hypothetical protein